MTSNRAGAGPADTFADGQGRETPWSDFQRVLDQMFDLLEGARQDDGAPAPTRAPRRPGGAGRGKR
ncbi:hypothetical protein [Streptomyces sp. TN58]|uniref:hypothetical protein n=1 Tax=Streptomyces sp. TN58 TaxID=234612 RepID=UPI0004AB32F3|nr:hypothetical protein [Streptomyces sp. TN58]APU38674.1 hypothetical protein BSL84_01700 [Streptomyces sp. TN58]